jgi:hypothetical protein
MFGLTVAPKNAPPLTPPPDGHEMRWWLEAREPLRRRFIFWSALPQFLVFVAAGLIRHPTTLAHPVRFAFVLLPLTAAVACGSAYFMWRSIEKDQKLQALRWKRIRESLLEGPFPPQPER